jgi:Flp pilus assembly protein TadD
LNDQQIAVIARWIDQGMVEGNKADAPQEPTWTPGWQLGPPDLTVTMPQPYTVPAEGPDVYRNFVVPIPLDKPRYVRAIEFRPGNAKVVHHAFLRLDATRQSRAEDSKDPDPGFGGIHLPNSAKSPDGHFLGWQPGRRAAAGGPADVSWLLSTNTDLVIQMHLKPSGRAEALQSSLGFYFTDQPPLKLVTKIRLTSCAIDIPAGATDYPVRDDYTLPVDVELLAVLPHAHFLASRLQVFAVLPDGSQRSLVRIPRWNFDWQGDYRFSEPIRLPRGTQLRMEYSYDNSTNNARNPNQPPKPVRYGPQSTDEMAEAWFQISVADPATLTAFNRDYQSRVARDSIAYNEYLLAKEPRDAVALTELAKAEIALARVESALNHLQAAAAIDPGNAQAHYFTGVAHRLRDRSGDAIRAFERALIVQSDFAEAHGNLGIIYYEQGDLPRAESCLRRALELNPSDSIAKESLDEIRAATQSRRR